MTLQGPRDIWTETEEESVRVSSEEARWRAIAVAGDMMGEIVSFWGFKASMGRIWTLLYLSDHSFPADVIADKTQLSAGAVSMALAELVQWGLITRDPTPQERKRHYRAETDVWAVIRRIFRERELRLVGRAVRQFESALATLEQAKRQSPKDPEMDIVIGRLKGLLELTRIGYRLVERFADIGKFSLLPIRGTLGRPRRSEEHQ